MLQLVICIGSLALGALIGIVWGWNKASKEYYKGYQAGLHRSKMADKRKKIIRFKRR